MLTLEFMILLLFVGLLGMIFIELSLPVFKAFSGVEGEIYGETLLYFVTISILSLCMMTPVIVHHKNVNKGKQYFFRKAALVLQFCIGMLFIFCMIVLMKQIQFLKNIEVGIERTGIASLCCFGEVQEGELEQVNQELKKLPVVNETLLNVCSLLPSSGYPAIVISDWDNKKVGDNPIGFTLIYHTQELARFYGIKLKEGEMVNKDDTDRILINETAVGKLGAQQPLGMKLGMYTVIGVVKDFHNTVPTVPIQPMIFLQNNFSSEKGLWCCMNDIIIKYEVDQWKYLKPNVLIQL